MFHPSVNSALFQDENEKAEDFLSHLWAQLPAEPAAEPAVSNVTVITAARLIFGIP